MFKVIKKTKRNKMNLSKFREAYCSIGSRNIIVIKCKNCNLDKTIQKHKAQENIMKNNFYYCHKCKTSKKLIFT